VRYKNIAVLKVTVLYTVGLQNTALYRPAVLIFNELSSWDNLFNFVLYVVQYAVIAPRRLQK